MKKETQNRNGLIYNVLNTLILLSCLITRFSWVNFALFLEETVLIVYLTTFRVKNDAAVCSDLPVLFFLDICFYVLTRGTLWLDDFSMYAFARIWLRHPLLLACGIALYAFAKKKNHTLLSWSVGSATGGVAVLSAWDNESVLALYLTACMLWYTCCRVSSLVLPAAAVRNGKLGTVLFCLFLVAVGLPAFAALMSGWLGGLQTLCQLSWWKTILLSMILLFCAAAMCDLESGIIGTDGYFLFFLWSFLFFMYRLTRQYFKYCWILAALFLAAGLISFPKQLTGQKHFRLNGGLYLAAQLVVFLLAARLLCRGWYLPLLTGMAAACVLYRFSDPDIRKRHGQLLWYLVLLCVGAETFALATAIRLSQANLITLLVITVFSGAAMGILNDPHPEQDWADDRYRLPLVGLTLLLCALTLWRHGTLSEASFLDGNQSVRISLTARGKENAVSVADYCWSDWSGRDVTPTLPLTGLSAEIPVEGDKLIVTATDLYGIRTTSVFWRPWMPSD